MTVALLGEKQEKKTGHPFYLANTLVTIKDGGRPFF